MLPHCPKQNPNTAQASCAHISILTCIDNDNCCPAVCNSNNDNDCQAICGNANCETGENQDNCCNDCGCPENYSCQNNQCVTEAYCGDGICNNDENCSERNFDTPAFGNKTNKLSRCFSGIA